MGTCETCEHLQQSVLALREELAKKEQMIESLRLKQVELEKEIKDIEPPCSLPYMGTKMLPETY